MVVEVSTRIYGQQDPREAPLYTYADAERALNIPSSTIRSWVKGQRYRLKDHTGYFEPLIRPPEDGDGSLSFTNLIEVFVLRTLRKAHEVKLDHVRRALKVAENEFGIQRLLIHRQLAVSAGKLFLDRYIDLVELSPSQQLVLREIWRDSLERIEYDEADLPLWFMPFPTRQTPDKKIIGINPYVSFGRPVVRRVGISTAAIVDRIDAGETKQAIIEDYNLSKIEFDEAVLYERYRRAA